MNVLYETDQMLFFEILLLTTAVVLCSTSQLLLRSHLGKILDLCVEKILHVQQKSCQKSRQPTVVGKVDPVCRKNPHLMLEYSDRSAK
jgi:hypothetical protein